MQVRKSIFETNSSSTHSVSISEGTDYVMPEIAGDTIEIEQGEYGWEQESYSDFFSKASYALTYAKNSGKQEDLETLRKVIEDFTKKKVVFAEDEGYIDHQSIDEAESIFASPESVKNFLFGKGSSFSTDNDNY